MSRAAKIHVRIAAENLFATCFGWKGRSAERVRVLTLHDIGENSNSIYTVTKGRFGDFLRVLKDEGYQTLRACDLVAGWSSILDRRRAVVLTFDDGYASHAETVAGLLSKHGMTGTFFIISSLVGKERKKAQFAMEQHAFLCERDLRSMASAGFEVGSHSHTHALCGAIPREQLCQEINTSMAVLNAALGREVSSFAYPFGRRGAYSAESRGVLAASGFTAGFTQEGLRIGREADPLQIPRVSIDRYDTPGTFRRKLRGRYELGARLRSMASICLRSA